MVSLPKVQAQDMNVVVAIVRERGRGGLGRV